MKDIWKDFARYVSLNILGQAAYACYTVADTFLVAAKVGANGLAALNLAFPMFCFVSGTGLMIGIGGGTGYAIARGRGEDEEANRAFTNAAILAMAFSLLYVLTGLLGSAPLARLLGADDELLGLTNTYLRTLLLFAPAFLANHLLQCFVRNDGKPSLSMAALIAGSVSNIALAYVFIFRFGWGIFGSILAAGLAPVIGIVVMLPHLLRGKCRFRLVRTRPSAKGLGAILATGVSPFLTEATSGVVMFVFNYIILRLSGNIGVAAFSVISVLSLAVVALYTGLSQGIQPILSRSYGMGNRADVETTLRCAVVTAALLSAALYAVLFFGAEPIAASFNSEGNPTLQAYAVAGIRRYFLACPFIGLNIVLATYFISTERPKPAQAISLLRGLLVLVPMAFLLSGLWGLTGVWYACPATEIVVALAGVVLFQLLKSGERDILAR